jgi:hypothetical protein
MRTTSGNVSDICTKHVVECDIIPALQNLQQDFPGSGLGETSSNVYVVVYQCSSAVSQSMIEQSHREEMRGKIPVSKTGIFRANLQGDFTSTLWLIILTANF